MSYIDQGFNQYLIRETNITPQIEPMDSGAFEYLVPEISGSQIVNYTAKNFNYIPTAPSANPKEGDVYYDSQDKKLKVYTGSAYEAVTSV